MTGVRDLQQEVLGRVVREILQGLAPSVSLSSTVEDNGGEILVTINLLKEGDEHGLLFGASWKNITLLKNFVRNQQLFPHNRFIRVDIIKPDGTVQTSWDRNVNSKKSEVKEA